jgi:hypothetical protein
MPDLRRVFARPPAPPATVTYRSIDPSYDVYGWHVAIDRPALEWSELRDASRSGFELNGSGTGTVTTARAFRPNARVAATIRTSAQTTSDTLRADRDGRVTLTIPLGPGNPYQEDTPQAKATGGTRVYTARVDLTPARSSRTRPGA